MHVEAGHTSSEPEDIPKDLRCPLCLYHTKNKSNMIDHIVLHRGRASGTLAVADSASTSRESSRRKALARVASPAAAESNSL